MQDHFIQSARFFPWKVTGMLHPLQYKPILCYCLFSPWSLGVGRLGTSHTDWVYLMFRKHPRKENLTKHERECEWHLSQIWVKAWEGDALWVTSETQAQHCMRHGKWRLTQQSQYSLCVRLLWARWSACLLLLRLLILPVQMIGQTYEWQQREWKIHHQLLFW